LKSDLAAANQKLENYDGQLKATAEIGSNPAAHARRPKVEMLIAVSRNTVVNL
jgi:hypothetical protein